jgi:putative copper export protein
MTVNFWLVFLHLLGASIWVGGHLILASRYVPEVLKTSNTELLKSFEQRYEKIGIPALLVQVATGVALAWLKGVPPWRWFHFHSGIEILVSYKLILLLATLALGLHARLVLIPSLNSKTLRALAWHVRLVTLLAVLLLMIGTWISSGGQ